MDDITDAAYRAVVESRIRSLWDNRKWFHDHLGWIPQERTDEREELLYLVRLGREARRNARAAAEHRDNQAKALERFVRVVA